MISENDKIKTNSLSAWVLAARPKTLTGAMVPVMIGTAWAWKLSGGENFRVIPAILCFLFAFLMQIDSNFINDYFDCLKGNDDRATRLGPKRACSEGWITLPAMRIGLVVTSLLASLVGIPLIFFGGWEMILVGAACVLFAFLYTTYFSYQNTEAITLSFDTYNDVLHHFRRTSGQFPNALGAGLLWYCTSRFHHIRHPS